MGTNARGGQQDLQILDESRDTNHNWDGVWHVKSHIGEDGWTAEFAIPLVAIAQRLDTKKYTKHKRNPKKPPPNKLSGKGRTHVSTARILAMRGHQ